MNADQPVQGWIRVQREAMGLSSYALARRAGVAQATVVNWERREREGTLTLASLRRAADAMGCDVTYRLTAREMSGEERPDDPPAGPVARKGKQSPVAHPSPPPKRPSAPRSATYSADPNDIWGG